jgi:hypothetical protein
MSQMALPLFPNAPHDSAHGLLFAADASAGEHARVDATGFEIGWDYAHYRLTPPADHLHGQHPVRQGWEAARATFGARTLKPTRAVRQWLELRLQAWLQGVPLEGVMLTPRYLAQIDALQCPVTREILTHGRDAPSDAVIMRLDLGAAFAAGHLVTVSRRVLQARGQADAQTVDSLARRLRAENLSQLGGLDATQWERLATLLSLAVSQPHARLACRPLHVLPPNRLRLLNPVQALQALLTQLFAGEAYARRMTALGTLMPDGDARRSYYLFMNAMLARRLAAGWAADRLRVRMTLEDAWVHPVIQRRWEQLALRLRESDCERIVRLAAQRGLAGPGLRWLDDDSATEGWMPPAPQPLLPPTGLACELPAAPSDAAGAVALRRWRRVQPAPAGQPAAALAA